MVVRLQPKECPPNTRTATADGAGCVCNAGYFAITDVFAASPAEGGWNGAICESVTQRIRHCGRQPSNP